MNATTQKAAFAAATVCALLPRPASAESEAEIRTKLVAQTQALMDALIPGNADVWQHTLADDAVIIDEFGRVQNRKEAIESVHPFPPGLSGSIEIRDPKLHLVGDTAVLQGEMYEKESVFGQPLVVRYIFANTFVRKGADWKLLAASDVTLPTEPPKLDVAGLVLGDYPGTYAYGPNRAFSVALENGSLFYTTKPGGPHTTLDAIGKDVFMSGGDERNLVIFRRDAAGHVEELIERRKFNDLHMKRDATAKRTWPRRRRSTLPP
ncbi:MAG: nuclear transport factor 2 family protein [Rhodanobacteraceae bacterium]